MRYGVIFFFLLTATAVQAGAEGAVTFVDGKTVKCEVLFKHPNCDRLIVRSLNNATVQSFDLKLVHRVEAGGKRRTYSPKRALTAAEKAARETNRLWADDVDGKRIANYAGETWKRKPLIVWAKPGESADAMNAECWLDENGKPFQKTPWTTEEYTYKRKKRKRGHFDGDVLLPAAGTKYKAIQPGNRDHLHPYTVRHLTIERNASYNIRYTVIGNLWLKDGSDIGGGTQTGGLGSGTTNKHTLVRFCGNRWPHRKQSRQGKPEYRNISHWVWIDAGAGSLEIIGKSGGAGDRLTLKQGTLIISTDSYIGNGNRGSFYTMKGTTAIFLDGAGAGCLDPVISSDRGTYGIDGTLMFGTRKYPLTRDLIFSGCWFRKGAIKPEAKPDQRTSGASFVLGPSGRMVVCSSDPKRARVLFCGRPKDGRISQYVLPRKHWGLAKPKNRDRFWAHDISPKGVAAVFRGQTDFNGVVFDDFQAGTILVAPAARKRWKNVSFGKNNKARPEELFRDL